MHWNSFKIIVFNVTSDADAIDFVLRQIIGVNRRREFSFRAKELKAHNSRQVTIYNWPEKE